MRLSWNEIRARAAHFADEWKDARYEKGQAQTFYNEFFEVFGVTRRRVASFEEPVKKLDGKHGFIDLFWKGVLLVEQKSAGGSLTKAKQQALDYFPGIKETDLPRHILVSDFQTFELYDLDGENPPVHFALSDLPKQIEHFGFILGVEKRTFLDQDPVNIEASELMGKLHDALKDAGYTGHDLERFLVRLLFCLFADDTGIFEPRGIFFELIDQRTREDGSDVGQWLTQLFEVLNIPAERRQRNLDEDLQKFPYVNGDLFKERLQIPAFDAPMRAQLKEVCEFSWDAISPAIFGSLFQSVMNKAERRASGAHYTTEKNIMKVIQPLFLDDLRAEFERLKARRDTGRRNSLIAFHEKLGNLRFFDPACGCGNFLVIAYRELRELEIALLIELNPKGQQTFFDVSTMSNIDVNQFYGIEIFEFPTRIAEVALWMMDHIMNNKLSLAFGDYYARIPLKASPHIHNADALEMNWDTVLSSKECSYVLGNPPFVGAKLQTEKQRGQVRRIARLGGSGGTLDYVCAWFIKAGEYIQNGRGQIGFVATNSITQGEHVAQLWPVLFNDCRLEIAFAHRTFAWGSDAKGKAHVHVVIIGLTRRDMEPPVKRLFSYDDVNGDAVESEHAALSPYLFDAAGLADKHLVVRETVHPLSAATPKMLFGNMPNDGGHLLLSPEVRAEIVEKEPALAKLIRPLIGAHDLINGEERYCFWLVDVAPEIIRKSPILTARLAQVRSYRAASKRAATRALSATPALFGEIRHTGRPSVVIPRHSSERREYVPMIYDAGNSIAHDSCMFVPDASLFEFAVLTSAMHMSWLRHIGGRLKNDYRYSAGLVLNTFPWPSASEKEAIKIGSLAEEVLDVRASFGTSTLADLYDPDVMPLELRRAHRALDAAVGSLYRSAPFKSDRERVEHLFGLYEKLVSPLIAATKQKKGKRHMPGSA
jgi:hypothetical protein